MEDGAGGWLKSKAGGAQGFKQMENPQAAAAAPARSLADLLNIHHRDLHREHLRSNH